MSNALKNNINAYEILYKVEVGLREYLIETFGRDNQKWWKQRIPSDVLDKVKKGREIEKSIKWVELLPHHPVYYIDFPDLRKTIERNDNWRDAFQNIFGNKTIFSGGLQELEPIRNKIAHSRRVSDSEIYLLRGNIAKIENAIGKERWDNLIFNQTVELSMNEKINSLRDFSNLVYKNMIECKPLDILDTLKGLTKEWWFDSDYLCQSLEPIERLLALSNDYIELPRHRGSGYIIEKWIKLNLPQELRDQIEETFNLLLAQQGA